MNFKSVIIIVFVLSFILFDHALHAEQPLEDLALTSAQRWLSLVDEGKYSESWDEASQYFKTAIPEKQWLNSLEAFRKPLGKTISRKLKSKQYTKTLPGAPDGEYVVIRYETSFEHKKSALETVTPMLDKDGKWRVSGYYIR
jgi:hypothetical protein